eukprot:COSAG02_NODE_38233_length_431_cov_1.509036_1_plen_75_part_01
MQPTFEAARVQQLETFVAEAQAVKPKLRNRAQREAIAQLRQWADDQPRKMFSAGPMPAGENPISLTSLELRGRCV